MYLGEYSNMEFMTQINTGKAVSFQDFINKKLQEVQPKQGMSKVASVQAPVAPAVKTANEKDEAESSGQLDVEPLHQEGESTPKVKGKTDAKGSDSATSASSEPAKTVEASGCQDKDNENNGPAKDSGQAKADFPKLTNDPDAGKHRSGDGDQKKADAAGEVKEAAKGCGRCKKEEVKTEETKEAAGIDNFGDKKAPPFGKKEETEEKADKKASSNKFIRLANLDNKSKAWLKKYWGSMYPAEYVAKMLGDK